MLWKDSLNQMGDKMYNWIEDLLKNRTFQVKSDEILFKKYNIENCTQRRSASPLLCLIMILIMINDINLLARKVIYPSDDISSWIEKNLHICINILQQFYIQRIRKLI